MFEKLMFEKYKNIQNRVFFNLKLLSTSTFKETTFDGFKLYFQVLIVKNIVFKVISVFFNFK